MNDIFDLKKLATGLDTGQAQTIDRVELWVDDNLYYRYPIVTEAQWDAMDGRILKAKCSFGTQEICRGIYLRAVGLTQAAGEIQGASLDPAVELGDTVIADGSAIYAGIIDSKLNDRNESTIKDVSEGDLEQDYDYESSILLQTQRNGVTIERTAEALTTKVEKDGVISAINQSAESITIEASKIDLNGYVTVTDLATAGSTVINGSNITTGTIDASKANITNINAENITTGTIDGLTITSTGTYSTGVQGTTTISAGTINSVGEGEIYITGVTDTFKGQFEGDRVKLEWSNTNGSSATTDILSGSIDIKDGDGSTTIYSHSQRTGVITRSSGLAISSQSIYRWGRVVMVSLTLATTATSYSAGAQLFAGTISSGSVLSSITPVAIATASGFWNNNSFRGISGRIDTSGNIVVKTDNAVTFTASSINISWTYLT